MRDKERNETVARIPPVLGRIGAEMEAAEALCESILDAPPPSSKPSKCGARSATNPT